MLDYPVEELGRLGLPALWLGQTKSVRHMAAIVGRWFGTSTLVYILIAKTFFDSDISKVGAIKFEIKWDKNKAKPSEIIKPSVQLKKLSWTEFQCPIFDHN